jgi:hypothetical protein
MPKWHDQIPDTMSPDQENHLASLISWVAENLDDKYRAGQKEHGGNLWEKPGMLYCLKQEVWDQLSYVFTLDEQIREADPSLHAYLNSPMPEDE